MPSITKDDMTQIVISAEVLMDMPWMSVAVIEFDHGKRYDFTWCEHTEPEDIVMFHADILPTGSLVMGAQETETLPGAVREVTVSYWIA